MTGLDKIVEQILADAQAKADEIVSTAKDQAQQILNDAQAQAQKQKEVSDTRVTAEKASRRARAESSAQLKKRQAMLKAKQQIISETIDKAYAQVLAQDDAAYFAMIEKMASKYALGKSGEIFFSAKDLGRMPAGFEAILEKAAAEKGGSLTLSKEAKNMDGGFILSYGGIEENCSFKAIFDSEREKLADKVNTVLFA